VTNELISVVEEMFTKPGSTIHQLVARPFHEKALEFWNDVGRPIVQRNNVWQIFSDILSKFSNWDRERDDEQILTSMRQSISEEAEEEIHLQEAIRTGRVYRRQAQDAIPLLPGLRHFLTGRIIQLMTPVDLPWRKAEWIKRYLLWVCGRS
jgi:hypothetical protein